MAAAQKPYFAPGSGYHYSNTNYLILGLIIESITKISVGEEIRTRLLLPYHLTETSYPTTDTMPAPWAHGYSLDPAKKWQDISGTIPVSLTGPAGAMISTLADMRRWVVLYVTGKTNAPATQQARLACLPTGDSNLSFGLGIGCSAGWYGYTGGLPGYNTAAYYDPEAGITILAWVTLQKDQPRGCGKRDLPRHREDHDACTRSILPLAAFMRWHKSRAADKVDRVKRVACTSATTPTSSDRHRTRGAACK